MAAHRDNSNRESLGLPLASNGFKSWARIGVVASVVWFLAGGIVGNSIAIGDAGRTTQLWFDGCVAANKRQFGEYGPYESMDPMSERSWSSVLEEC